MKKVLGGIGKWLLVVVAGGLMAFLMIRFPGLEAGVRVLYILLVAAAVALTVWLLVTQTRGAKRMGEKMTEVLRAAAGVEQNSLCGSCYGNLLRLNRKALYAPCFCGVTDKNLLIACLDAFYTPNPALCFAIPREELADVRLRRSVASNQRILELQAGGERFRLRFYLRDLPKMELAAQQENTEILLDALRAGQGEE